MRPSLTFTLPILCLFACSDSTTNDPVDASAGADAAAVDAAPGDAAPVDLGLQDAGAPVDLGVVADSGVPASCTAGGAGTRVAGERCGCRLDCAGELTCSNGACLPTACRPQTPDCPEGWTCQTNMTMQSRCVACLGTDSVEGDRCVCGGDCGAGLACAAGACRRPCAADSACNTGEECVPQLFGPGICAAIPAACVGAGATAIGDRCSCNADCVGETPLCLDVAVGAMSVGRFCTRRPCDLTSSTSCGGGGALCCAIEPVLPATCFNNQIGQVLGAQGTCSP